MKAKKLAGIAEELPRVVFWCPGCKHHHTVPYTTKLPMPTGPVWFCDERWDAPTISPSLRVFMEDGVTTACHVVVANGILNYCVDAGHALRGQSIPMEDIAFADGE